MIVNWQIKQLQAQVKKLKREKELLRLFLHELVEAHYRVVNQEPEAKEPEPKKEANHE